MALPTSKSTFSTRFPGQQVTADHVNQLQTSVRAIEDNLDTNAQGGSATVSARIGAVESSKASLTSAKGFVNHGSTAGTARPSGYVSVEWYGSVEPTNAINGDTWINTA